MANPDSSIRSEGAELYVQSILMLEFGVITSRASRNMIGYDIIAHNLKKRRDCKISVKYRKASNSDGFRFTHLSDFDYFVGIIGKRGKIGRSSADDRVTDMLAQVYVLTRQEVRKAVRKDGKNYLLPRNTKVLAESRKDAWNRILHYLELQ